MNRDAPTAPLVGGVALLERAIGYTLGSLLLVTPELMARPSPCEGWLLGELLQHMNDSLATLHEAGAEGRVGEAGADGGEDGRVDVTSAHDFGDPHTDPVGTLRRRACTMLGAWACPENRPWVDVQGWPVTGDVVSATGALEITVHGWDVAAACGVDRPIPPSLAGDLLALARVLVTEADRPSRFAQPQPPASLEPSARLLAFLGRRVSFPSEGR